MVKFMELFNEFYSPPKLAHTTTNFNNECTKPKTLRNNQFTI